MIQAIQSHYLSYRIILFPNNLAGYRIINVTSKVIPQEFVDELGAYLFGGFFGLNIIIIIV